MRICIIKILDFRNFIPRIGYRCRNGIIRTCVPDKSLGEIPALVIYSSRSLFPLFSLLKILGPVITGVFVELFLSWFGGSSVVLSHETTKASASAVNDERKYFFIIVSI